MQDTVTSGYPGSAGPTSERADAPEELEALGSTEMLHIVVRNLRPKLKQAAWEAGGLHKL